MVSFRMLGTSLRFDAALRDNLSWLVQHQGRDRIVTCGSVMAERFQVPMVAWYLHLPFSDIQMDPDTPTRGQLSNSAARPAVIFQSSAIPGGLNGPSEALSGARALTGAPYRASSTQTMKLYQACSK